MNPAVAKTLSLVLLIGLGLLLQKKLKGREELGGVKLLILSIALPATIFVALLKIEVEPTLLFLPVLALAFNFVMLGASQVMLPLLGVERGSRASRTLTMLLPSLAPGLSCFPFIAEYLGDEPLAWAALADVGNKVFVLILLYLLAMHWHHRLHAAAQEGGEGRLKGLLLSLVREPVNLVIVTALVMLSFGLHLDALPVFMQDAVGRMASLMTPLVLLFIGLAVRIRWRDVSVIAALLSWRAGMAFVLAAVAIAVLPLPGPAAALVAVVFPLSACSFWPFAHMAAIATLESGLGDEAPRTFDTDLALAVLACSLPFSTTLILAVCSTGALMADPMLLLGAGGLFLALSALPVIGRRVRASEPSAPPTQAHRRPSVPSPSRPIASATTESA